MVLKATSIHSNFFPSGERYATADAHNDGDADVTASTTPAGGPTPSGTTPAASRRPSAEEKAGASSPRGFFKRKMSQKNGGDSEKPSFELPHGAQDGNIILVTWDGEDDPENPLNWPQAKKNMMTAMLCVMCLFIGLATAGYASGLQEMTREFQVSAEVGQVGLFLFNAAFSIVPLFLGPLSEFIGAAPVYLFSYAGFVLFFIPIALAKNIGTVLVSRFILGAFGATGTTIVPGTLASIWRTEERGNKVALFSLVAVLGTVGAPLYNGFIEQQKGWRWIEWVQLIVNGAVFIIELIFLRETRGSVILTRRAKKLRKQTGDQRYRAPTELEAPSLKALLHASTTRAALLLVREPVVFTFSLWLAYEWALIFALFSGIPLVFQGLHGWGTGVGGLAYIGPIIGTFLAWGINFHAVKLYDNARAKNGGVPVPEARLYYATVGGILSTIGMFIFAFTSYKHVHWMGPEIGLVLLIMGIYFVFDAVQNYLSDAYGSEYGASAISAQGFVRNLLAASFPLFTTQMFNTLTIPFAGLLLACLLALAVPLPFILIKYGERIRAKSRYAATMTGITPTDADDQEKQSRTAEDPVLGATRSRKVASMKRQQQQSTTEPVQSEVMQGSAPVSAEKKKEKNDEATAKDADADA